MLYFPKKHFNIISFLKNFTGKRLAFLHKTGYDAIRKQYTKEVCGMQDDFGPNFITLTDDDGNDIELEYVDALEHNGETYMAFFPAVEDEAEDAEDYGLVILKSVTEDGEEFLSTLDSDEELNEIYDLFMEQILADEEENS